MADLYLKHYLKIINHSVTVKLVVSAALLISFLLPVISFAEDIDADGINDGQDNCIEIPNPDQRDTNGDGFGNLCDADLDDNGTVSFADLNLFKSKFGTADQDADFDGNGSVSFADLNIFKSLFGQPPGPSAVKIELDIPHPVYDDPANIPELTQEWYGAMVGETVNKISINNPAYPNEIVNKGNIYPGDNSFYFGSNDETVRLKVDMYTPSGTIRPRPTVFFISGWRHYFSEQYYSLLYFIANQGFNAVFVSYEETRGSGRDLIKQILEQVVADPRFSPRIDTSKVGFMGHSLGAGILFHLSIELNNWGTQGRFIFPLAGATAFYQDQQQITLPANTAMIVQTYNEKENDRIYNWDTDPRFSIDYLVNSNINDSDKTFLYLPGDELHESNHSTPKSRYENGVFYFDALQQIGLFRPLESLMRYSFENDTVWKHIGLPDSDMTTRTNNIEFYSGDNPYSDLNINDDPSNNYRFRFNDSDLNPHRTNYCCN